MEIVRKNIVKSSVLFTDKNKKSLFSQSNFLLEYSEITLSGYRLGIKYSNKNGYIITFGCQNFTLALLKEIRDNLNGIYKTVDKKLIVVDSSKTLRVKKETENQFLTFNGEYFDKSSVETINKSSEIKKIKLVSFQSYWGNSRRSEYTYNGYEIGTNKNSLLIKVNYCIDLLEEIENLNNKIK